MENDRGTVAKYDTYVKRTLGLDSQSSMVSVWLKKVYKTLCICQSKYKIEQQREKKSKNNFQQFEPCIVG